MLVLVELIIFGLFELGNLNHHRVVHDLAAKYTESGFILLGFAVVSVLSLVILYTNWEDE